MEQYLEMLHMTCFQWKKLVHGRNNIHCESVVYLLIIRATLKILTLIAFYIEFPCLQRFLCQALSTTLDLDQSRINNICVYVCVCASREESREIFLPRSILVIYCFLIRQFHKIKKSCK